MNSQSLSARDWTCPVRNTLHDRDVNAARNLKGVAESSAVSLEPVYAVTSLGSIHMAFIEPVPYFWHGMRMPVSSHRPRRLHCAIGRYARCWPDRSSPRWQRCSGRAGRRCRTGWRPVNTLAPRRSPRAAGDDSVRRVTRSRRVSAPSKRAWKFFLEIRCRRGIPEHSGAQDWGWLQSRDGTEMLCNRPRCATTSPTH